MPLTLALLATIIVSICFIYAYKKYILMWEGTLSLKQEVTVWSVSQLVGQL